MPSRSQTLCQGLYMHLILTPNFTDTYSKFKWLALVQITFSCRVGLLFFFSFRTESAYMDFSSWFSYLHPSRADKVGFLIHFCLTSELLTFILGCLLNIHQCISMYTLYLYISTWSISIGKKEIMSTTFAN
jgi:hypothetical protein